MKAEKEIQKLKSQNSRNENKPVQDLIARIEKFKDLEQDWDTYGSEKISLSSIYTAIKLIKIFGKNNINVDNAFPMRDGGVQL